jgi:hypothetical protein
MPTNIAITGEVYGKTTIGKVLESGSTVVSNATASGKIIRVNSLLVANTTGSSNADLIAVIRRGGDGTAASIYFDGASYLSMDTNAGMSFSGNFTVEAFVYLISNGDWGGIIDCRSSGGQSSWVFGVRNNSYQRLYWVDASNSERNSDAPIFFNRWTHVAVVKNGSSIYFYIDGVRDTLVTASSAAVTAQATSPVVGKTADNYYFNGYIEELRVSDTARYTTSTFTVPSSPFANNHANSKLLLHGDGGNGSTTFTDSVTSPHTLTRFGNTRISTARSVFAGEERRIANAISVPTGATLCLTDKPIYLEEGDSLVCLASTNERLEYTCSYEEIG